jgi:Protease inhibitor Inh
VPAELTMPGRWMLAAPNAPPCGVNFTGKPSANEGTVTPEGGCPERFFTSRRWTLRQNALTISDDDSNALAQFSFAGDRFEGKSNAGTPLTLER